MAAGIVLLLASCTNNDTPTRAGRACELAPPALVERDIGVAVPPGRDQRLESTGAVAGCVYEIDSNRGVAVSVREHGGRASYDDWATSIGRFGDTSPVDDDRVEGVRVTPVPPGRPATYLLVDGRTFVAVQLYDEGTDKTLTQGMADRLALDVAAAILGKPASTTTTLG